MADRILIDRAVVQQALEALQHLAGVNCDHSRGICVCEYRQAGDALRTALAQQAEPGEPVGWNWMLDGQPYGQAYYGNPPDTDIAERAAIAGRTVRLLYTAPPQRKPLTEEEIDELSRTMVKGDKSVNWLCRAIERARGIKEKA